MDQVLRDIEVKCVGKLLVIAESSAPDFDGFSPTVDAFGRAVTEIFRTIAIRTPHECFQIVLAAADTLIFSSKPIACASNGVVQRTLGAAHGALMPKNWLMF